MVGKVSGRVIVTLDGRFAQEGKRLGDFDVVGRLPFIPYSLESFPGTLRQGTFQEAMLRGFFHVGIAHFACRSDSHDL